MNKFFEENFNDFKNKNNALKNNPEINLANIKESEFSQLEKYKNQMSEYKDKFAEVFFKKINPLNLPLKKIKEQLEEDINELRIELASFQNNPETTINLSDEEKLDLYEKNSGAIKEKLDWIQKIEDFLATNESDPFEDVRDNLQDKWNTIESIDPKLN